MDSADVAWSRMDIPSNLMIVNAILMFEEGLDFVKLKTTVEQRLLKFRRFHQCVVYRKGTYYWEEAADFNVDDHFHEVELPGEGGQEELQNFTSKLISVPLDSSKPLWQMYLVKNHDGSSAVVIRIHHCIGDGIALVGVLLSMTDATPDVVWREEQDPPHMPDTSQHITTTLGDILPIMKHLSKKTLETLTTPSEIRSLFSLGGRFVLSLGKLLLIPPDAKTIFKGKLGNVKHVAWSKPIPIEDFKKIGMTMGGKINDAVITATSGALRRYMEKHEASFKNINMRVVIPVNLRPVEKAEELGNRFGVVFLSLPLGIEDPVERLQEVHRRMENIKSSLEAIVAFGLLHFFGMLPRPIQRSFLFLFSLKSSSVLTNVPGPQEPLYLAGKELRNIMFWVPQIERTGMGISILSYNGKIMLGVTTDDNLVKDPESIINGFHEEIEALIKLCP